MNRPAGDEEVLGLWHEIGKQYRLHKWSNVKTFKFDLQGYRVFPFEHKILLFVNEEVLMGSFRCRKLTDKSLEIIAKELSKNFRSLETLVLSFEEYKIIGFS